MWLQIYESKLSRLTAPEVIPFQVNGHINCLLNPWEMPHVKTNT
jgi:hypothetical protein